MSTIKATTEERPKGSRQVKAPARLGHYTSGTKAIDTSVGASTISKLIVTIVEDGDDDSDRMCVGHIPHDKQKSSLIPGRYSLIRPGEVEEPRGQTMHNADKELIAVMSSLKDNRPTVKSFFDAGRGSSSILQAQNSGSVLPEVDNNTQMLTKGERAVLRLCGADAAQKKSCSRLLRPTGARRERPNK